MSESHSKTLKNAASVKVIPISWLSEDGFSVNSLSIYEAYDTLYIGAVFSTPLFSLDCAVWFLREW